MEEKVIELQDRLTHLSDKFLADKDKKHLIEGNIITLIYKPTKGKPFEMYNDLNNNVDGMLTNLNNYIRDERMNLELTESIWNSETLVLRFTEQSFTGHDLWHAK